jgi:hypothetical protein
MSHGYRPMGETGATNPEEEEIRSPPMPVPILSNSQSKETPRR